MSTTVSMMGSSASSQRERMRMRELLVGHDHGMGRGRAGDAEVLTALGAERGFRVEVVPPVSAGDGGAPVSSSEIRRAVAAGPGTAFKEDAMARLVRAYATMGATGECNRARGAYLESYPQGVHATAVTRACGNSP
jgi:FAD synthase